MSTDNTRTILLTKDNECRVSVFLGYVKQPHEKSECLNVCHEEAKKGATQSDEIPMRLSVSEREWSKLLVMIPPRPQLHLNKLNYHRLSIFFDFFFVPSLRVTMLSLPIDIFFTTHPPCPWAKCRSRALITSYSAQVQPSQQQVPALKAWRKTKR